MKSIYDFDEFFQEYAKMGRSIGGLDAAGEWHQFREMIPDVKGKTVLDLGCGYGWHCEYLAQQGAEEVIGIDCSEKMLEVAREKHSAPNITYLCGQIENMKEEMDLRGSYEFFDLVLSNLALHYVEDLTDTYEAVYDALKPGGVFLFNIEHPSFTAGVGQDWVYDADGKPLYWPIDNYYYPGLRETNFLGMPVVKFHHTLSQILNPLIDLGFIITRVEEAMPPEDMLDIPGMKDEMRRPMMLLVRAEKQE